MSALDKFLKSDCVETFGKGSPARIRRYQDRYDVRLSRAYGNFLVRCNGMRVSFDDEAREAAGLHMALTDINTFYGIGLDDGRDYYDLDVLTARFDANTRRLTAFAPVIAIGGDSCHFVEISRGERAGQIHYTDGEIHGSVLRRTDWSRPAEALIEEFVDDGFFSPVAASFAELLAMYLMLV